MLPLIYLGISRLILKCQKEYLYIYLLIIDHVCLLGTEMFEICYIMLFMYI